MNGRASVFWGHQLVYMSSCIVCKQRISLPSVWACVSWGSQPVCRRSCTVCKQQDSLQCELDHPQSLFYFVPQEKNFTVKLARLLHFWIQTNLKSQIHKRLILVTIEDNIFWPSVMSLSFHLYVCKRQFEQKEALWGDPNKNCHKHKSFRRHLVQPTPDKVGRDNLLISYEWQRQIEMFLANFQCLVVALIWTSMF